MKTFIITLCIVFLGLAINNLSLSQVNVTPNPQTYTTLYAAFNAINAGAHTNGAINITITANVTEIFQARLNGGVFTSCTIMPSANVTITSNISIPVIFINGADNVTIDGRIGGVGSTRSLTITNYRNNATEAACVTFNNGASNNILRYVICKVSSALTTTARPIVIDLSSPLTGGNNNNIIEFCNTQGGITGIKCAGTEYYDFTNDNNIIRNNRIKNTISFGIFLGSYVNNITCDNNEIFFDSAVVTSVTFRGIQIQSAGTINIRNNKLYSFDIAVGTNTEFKGIFLAPVNMPEPIPVTNVNIINNSISLSPNNTEGSGKGIDGIKNFCRNDDIRFLPYTANIFNNTILLGGTTAPGFPMTTACIYSGYFPGPLTNNYVINTFNNITINRRNGGDLSSPNVGILKDNTNSYFTINSDYNFCYASNPLNGYPMMFRNSLYGNSDLDLFKSETCELGIEQHTVFKDVNFVSSTDLHLAGTVGGDMCGTPVASVTTDIDGTIRNSLYPYKGCDEGAAFKILTLGAKLQGVTSPEGITVSLLNNSCQTVATATSDLSSGSGIFCFGDSISNGTGYYIDVKTKNNLETYSAALQTFTGNALSYDFKTSSSQAYGSNMILDGNEYAFYGGDINRDGVIDGADGSLIDNDVMNFVEGCNLNTDINNDGMVDGSDVVIQDNNAFKFIALNTPCL